MALALSINAKTDRQLTSLVQSMTFLDKEVTRLVRWQSRLVIDDEWRKGVRERAKSPLQHRMLADTARVVVSDRNVGLRSGATRGSLKGFPANSNMNAQRVEFGGNPDKKTTYQRKPKRGNTHSVTRRTAGQLGLRYRNGNAVFPAAENLIPRIRKLWIQTAVRTIHDSLEEVLSRG